MTNIVKELQKYAEPWTSTSASASCDKEKALKCNEVIAHLMGDALPKGLIVELPTDHREVVVLQTYVLDGEYYEGMSYGSLVTDGNTLFMLKYAIIYDENIGASYPSIKEIEEIATIKTLSELKW